VSSREQEREGFSLDVQGEALNRYAERAGDRERCQDPLSHNETMVRVAGLMIDPLPSMFRRVGWMFGFSGREILRPLVSACAGL